MVRTSRLLGTVSFATLAALAFPAAALAQPDSAQSNDEAIVVTGSRIARPADTSPTPVTSVDQQSIEQSGETNLTNYLQGIPALTGSSDTSQNSGSQAGIGTTGLNLLNLRNLGVERTLVLVDGRRHVAALPSTSAIDIGVIPQDLIERIDVTTGSVSAVYGADAVSGVVNFVMRRDFEGISVRGQIGTGAHVAPVNWTASVTAGRNFADGRGNVALAYQFTHEGRLLSTDRSYLRGTDYCTLQENQGDANDDPAVPDFIPYCAVQFFDSSREGAVDIDFDAFPDFRPSGSPYNIGQFITPFYSVGGNGTLRSDYIGDLLAESNRHVVTALGRYEFSEAAELFGELRYARTQSFSESQPTFDYTIFLAADNPFISPGVRAQIIPGIGDALSGAFGLAPGSIPDGIAVARDNFDLGVRGEDAVRETIRGVAGLRGRLTDWLRYELSYVYGQSSATVTATNNRYNDRFFAAIDVVAGPNGQPTCRSNLNPNALSDNYTYNFFQGYFFNRANLSFTPGANSGCRPLNILGEGVASGEALDWVFTDSVSTSKLTQNVVTGYLSGNVPGLELPGGPVGFVVGGEYRRESSRSTPAPEDTADQTFGNIIRPVRGAFDVIEAFAEVRLPILADTPFFHQLEATGAARYSHYSTVGGTFTWNAALRWAPVRDLAFRASYAQTVRAPNIAELFQPESQTFEFISDPCDIQNQNNGTEFRAPNCATVLNALGINPATFQDPNSFSISGFGRGNPNLSEETSETWTAGAVLRPRFIPGLSISADWYDIRIRNAINTAEGQDVADLCVDQPTLNNIFCAVLTRNPQNGAINGFSVQPENVADFRTAGLDFQVNYRFDPRRLGIGDIGIFNIQLLGNYLHRLEFINTPGAPVDDDRREQFAPKWQVTLDITWQRGPLSINYGFNYFSPTSRYSNASLVGDPDLASRENIFFNSRHTHDVRLGYDVRENFNIYAGVNNVADQRPDFSTFYPVNAIGRFFFLGARVNFGRR